LLACVGLALAGCKHGPEGPIFVATATPEVRAAITRLCVDATRADGNASGDDLGRAYSMGRCDVSLHYEPADLRITYLTFSTSSRRFGPRERRRFLEEVALPLLARDLQDYVKEHVLAHLDIETSVHESDARGSLHYYRRAAEPPDAEHDVLFAFSVNARGFAP
jgi:hypothetical protein